MPRKLEGKVAVVTAATAGIGLGIAYRLASDGAKVYISSRKQENVDQTITQLRSEGLEVSGCVCHVGSDEHRQRLVANVTRVYGKIDVLVSNAAVNPVDSSILDTSEDAITKILDINIKAAIMLVKAAAPHMASGSSITFVSSLTAYSPPWPIGVYAVSKTALLGLTKGLATELGPQGIRVNCVAPGVVPTKFAAALVASPELHSAQVASTALGRLGTPADMAGAVSFLASEDAAYITGETLVVAGGMTSRL